MRQRISLLIFIIFISSILPSCAPAAPEEPIPTETTPIPPIAAPPTSTHTVTQTETPTNTPKPNNSDSSVPLLQPIANVEPTSTHYEPSRINPVPFGSKGSLGVIDFLVVDFIRPATNIVMDASSANIKPDEGMEYVFVSLLASCVGPRHLECWIKQNNMRLIGSNGIERRPKSISEIQYLFRSWHIKGGDTACGWVGFIVDQNEDDFVFYYETELDGTIYLSTEPIP
jgi:hypothetical protein